MDPQKNVNPAAPAATDEDKDLRPQTDVPQYTGLNAPQDGAGVTSDGASPAGDESTPGVTPDAAVNTPVPDRATVNAEPVTPAPSADVTNAVDPAGEQPSIASDPASPAENPMTGSVTPTSVTGTTPDMSTPPVDASQSPLPTQAPGQQFEQGVPATAPVAAPRGDKKTVLVLLVVAVVLIAAIAALYLM